MKYFLSLGSNLGAKRRNLMHAVSLLKKRGLTVLRSSSLYRTQPVGYSAQSWFYNQVIKVETGLKPLTLLKLVNNIEKEMKRKPAVRNGPRRIDIDILLAEDKIVRTKRLIIPHPRMTERNFVLRPLREIAPHVVHPGLKKKIEALWNESKDPSIVIKV
ncbi:MAG: 2-amino-4-hydroxy-6-hydroxymethyldihydropteridine diphosphokinase [Candidatus Aminicenantales bacterium]